MALMNCPECGERISDTSEVCIHCGYQLKHGKEKKSFNKANIAWIVAALLTGFILLKNCITVFLFSGPFTWTALIGQAFLIVAVWVIALVVYIVVRLLAK